MIIKLIDTNTADAQTLHLPLYLIPTQHTLIKKVILIITLIILFCHQSLMNNSDVQ